jgi:glutathionylspermidine synthase
MQRETLIPRAGWQQKCESVGFSFHSQDGAYWDESACYRFSASEIDSLETAAAELHAMCLKAVERVVAEQSFDPFALPPGYAAYVTESWRRRQFSLFGRFDLRYDGGGPPKLLEYNADTPTSLVEASVAQWFWLTEVHPRADQFNSLHEKLIAGWRALLPELTVQPVVHFTCVADSAEDVCNIEYLMDTALQAGIDARMIAIADIGWDGSRRRFVDLDEAPIFALCKLYPWEWMAREAFGAHLAASDLRVIEPPWKMLLSNKAILALLWEWFPDHPYLLPAYFEEGRIAGAVVKKPLLAREGANVAVEGAGLSIQSEDRGYGAEGHVYQAYRPLPDFGGGHAVIGAWIAGGEPAGIGIREDRAPITSNTSRFVPHYFT